MEIDKSISQALLGQYNEAERGFALERLYIIRVSTIEYKENNYQ